MKLDMTYHVKAHKYYYSAEDYGIQRAYYEEVNNISIETAQRILKDFEHNENIDEMIFRRHKYGNNNQEI